MFSKLRSSIGGLYAWRRQHPASPQEKERMTKEADLAFRRAFALCPYSPEAVYRYVNFLVDVRRIDDAALIASASLKVDPGNQQLRALVTQLEQMAKR